MEKRMNKTETEIINQRRLTILRECYQNPTIVNFSFDTKVSGECSDMFSF